MNRAHHAYHALRFTASPRARGQRQRGAATLVVVMVLFFVIALVAAYTSRNLVFEQRTSANQYRSTVALDVADAGVEWAVSMLNSGLVETNCTASTNLANNSFRQRYLEIDPANGKIVPVPTAALSAACVWNGTGWTCACPTAAAAALTLPTGGAVYPAFRVRFRQLIPLPGSTEPPRPSAVWVDVVACTRLDAAGATDPCLTFDSTTSFGVDNEGRAVVSAMVALAGHASSPPVAPLTARQGVNLGSAAMTVSNSQQPGSGITVQAGSTVALPGLNLVSLAGTPPAASLRQSDPGLSGLATVGTALQVFDVQDRMFASVFNTMPETFRNQQGAVELRCTATPCGTGRVRDAIALNPGRPLWVDGDLIVDNSSATLVPNPGDIGSAIAPVVMVVRGNVNFSVTGVNIFGLVYLRTAAPGWTVSAVPGAGQITGAVVSDRAVAGSPGGSAPTLSYDPAVMTRLRYTVGSFVRVPGSWRDYR